mmetsp:Transcript_35611/g.88562  ORF Transcript_35611/g.88562 Transcript_35611/m.88562 type:complete len:240 (+) Transcript_35611:1478-2197(+)
MNERSLYIKCADTATAHISAATSNRPALIAKPTHSLTDKNLSPTPIRETTPHPLESPRPTKKPRLAALSLGYCTPLLCVLYWPHDPPHTAVLVLELGLPLVQYFLLKQVQIPPVLAVHLALLKRHSREGARGVLAGEAVVARTGAVEITAAGVARHVKHLPSDCNVDGPPVPPVILRELLEAEILRTRIWLGRLDEGPLLLPYRWLHASKARSFALHVEEDGEAGGAAHRCCAEESNAR